MILEDGIKLDFSDVLIRPRHSLVNSRSEVNTNVFLKFENAGATWYGTPIIASNMDGVGTPAMANVLFKHNMLTCLTKNTTDLDSISSNVRGNVIASTGTSETDLERLEHVLTKYPEILFICVDVANGYADNFIKTLERLRKKYPNHVLMAGNIVTPDIIMMCSTIGVDAWCVGIGSGSVCLTRTQTGIGYPQFSAIRECHDAANKQKVHLISDGGHTCPGDLAKSFGAGASFCMLGSMLAGCDEGGGEQFTRWKHTGHYYTNDSGEVEPILKGERRVQFYGMSSKTAQEKHHGGVADYRSSEGRTVEIPYKGPVEDVVKDILGGLRSTCSYIGAKSLSELHERAIFIRVNNQLSRNLEQYTTGN